MTIRINWKNLRQPNIYGSIGQFFGMVVGILIALDFIVATPFIKFIVLLGLILWAIGTAKWWSDKLVEVN